MRKIRNKNKKTLIIVALLVVITLGYAYLSQLLTINGTGVVDNMSWDIHFGNYQATSNSNITPTTAPDTSGNNKTTISYAVAFDTPGQVYEFTVDTVNAGNINAMVKSYTSTIQVGSGEVLDATIPTNIPNYLNYSITYSDDIPIANNHLLAKNTSETIKVHLELKKDTTPAELEEARGKTITLTTSINYEQADGNEVVRPKVYYEVSGTSVSIGQSVPAVVNLRSNATAAMADWAAITGVENDTKPFYLKHIISGDGKSTANYVGVIINDDVKTAWKTAYCSNSSCETKFDNLVNGTYTLQYGTTQEIYEKNKDVIKAACNYAVQPNIFNDQDTAYSCYIEGFSITTKTNGLTYIKDGDGYNCATYSGGGTHCEQWT